MKKNINKSRSTFLGSAAMQTLESFQLWELLLNKGSFKRIIELGTWQGALSLYFALYSIEQNMDFYTYDNKDYYPSPLKKFINFDQYFQRLDIFSYEHMIAGLISKPERTLLFCDNGNKIREFNTFAPYLKSNDIIGVHDWDAEISLEDIKETCEKYNLKIYQIMKDQTLRTNIQLFKKG